MDGDDGDIWLFYDRDYTRIMDFWQICYFYGGGDDDDYDDANLLKYLFEIATAADMLREGVMINLLTMLPKIIWAGVCTRWPQKAV